VQVGGVDLDHRGEDAVEWGAVAAQPALDPAGAALDQAGRLRLELRGAVGQVAATVVHDLGWSDRLGAAVRVLRRCVRIGPALVPALRLELHRVGLKVHGLGTGRFSGTRSRVTGDAVALVRCRAHAAPRPFVIAHSAFAGFWRDDSVRAHHNR
jgi:hypothetical protein